MTMSKFKLEKNSDGKFIIRYFVSYAHSDESLKIDLIERLQLRLNLLKDFSYVPWHDGDILSGERWHDEIQKAINSCHIGLRLISYNFLGGKYILEDELPNYCAYNKSFPELPGLSLPVGLRPIKFDGVFDLKGLDEIQILTRDSRFFGQERTEINKDKFADLLCKAVLDLSKKYIGSNNINQAVEQQILLLMFYLRH